MLTLKCSTPVGLNFIHHVIFTCSSVGYSYVNDESGLLMGHMTLWSFSDIKRIIRCLQVTIVSPITSTRVARQIKRRVHCSFSFSFQSSTPMRHKSTYFINVPNFADKFFTATVSFLNTKLKSRVKVMYLLQSLYIRLPPLLYESIII